MLRLTRYLTVQFYGQALSFLAVAVVLVWVTQTLRLFDLVTAKGQDLITLLGQSVLTTPPLARAILFFCFAVGLARALKALQASRELHIIHAGRRVGALWAALVIFIIGGSIMVSVLAHFLEPAAQRTYNRWSEEVAADLVGRALVPNRFTEAVPGMIVSIGGRRPDGTVTEFFAHDQRKATTLRTYQADTALILFTEEGYELSLRDGSIQYLDVEGGYTEIAFNRYELGLQRLTAESSEGGLNAMDTPSLLRLAETSGMTPRIKKFLDDRFSELSRLIGVCILIAALASFPNARRGRTYFPLELAAVILCLADRVISTSFSAGLPFGPYAVAIIYGMAGLTLIAWQYRVALYVLQVRRPA